ncbi:MAG: ATP-binding cassette domain-containing protein, partial [Candidatus Limnocylindrales bacterium]
MTGVTSVEPPQDPAAPEGPPPPAALAGVSKRFAGTQALQDVSLDLAAGEIHGLVGENGAGKSTIVKVFAGIHPPDSGTVMLDGQPVLVHGPAQARALGIAVVHQEP